LFSPRKDLTYISTYAAAARALGIVTAQRLSTRRHLLDATDAIQWRVDGVSSTPSTRRERLERYLGVARQ